MFHGEPHNGKTIFLLKLAQYLAENFPVMCFMCHRRNLHANHDQEGERILNPLPSGCTSLKTCKTLTFRIISLSFSIQWMTLDWKSMNTKNFERSIRQSIHLYPSAYQSRRFQRWKDWEHIAEIAGEVHKGVVNISKNRYAPKSTLDFFRQFGIQWQEPMTKQKN